MAEALTVSGPVGSGLEISFETGRLAGLADGAVLARMGDTVALVTATMSKNPRPGVDFFPLTVDVEERLYAAGKIPGSFFRREGRATDQAILVCRLMDRPLRPCFPKGFRNDVHVVATILGVDLENPHDIVAMNGASAALMISGIPFGGPVGAVRVAFNAEGEWVPNPTYQEGEASAFEMVVAGRAVGDDIAVMMVEAGGTEASVALYEAGTPKVTEERIAEGIEKSKVWIREMIDVQLALVAKVGEVPTKSYTASTDYTEEVLAAVEKYGWEKLAQANSITTSKQERAAALDAAEAEIEALVLAEMPDAAGQVPYAVKAVTKKLVRERILKDGVRIDGRGLTDIRPLSAEVGLIPRAHGSGLFTRGETQVLNVATLGMPRMNQMLDTIGITDTKRYMHHYNFPPFSTGEAGNLRGPKRREIGHGMLAERALLPVIPPVAEFPYTLRLVSEVLSSNGSTSMASVCGSTLSLLDAGVPIRGRVGGIAMGLVSDGERFATLTDILGAEDAFGDMDFKVAGTADFVTALQLDTKLNGLPSEVLAQALVQAREARYKVLEVINTAVPTERTEVNPNAPRIVSIQVPIDKVGEVIGPKGKVINAIQSDTGAEITVDDDGIVGTVTIGSTSSEAVKEARRRIELILDPPKAEVGASYEGVVAGITKFGAFITILPGRDGLLHISKMGGGRRVENVEDVLTMGQAVTVVVESIDATTHKVSLALPEGVSLLGKDSGPSAKPSADGAPAGSLDSFEAEFEKEIERDLGPVTPPRDRGPRRNESRSPRRSGR